MLSGEWLSRFFLTWQTVTVTQSSRVRVLPVRFYGDPELNRKRGSDRDAAYESWDDSGSLGPATERDALSWLRLRLNASAFWLLLRGVRGDSTS